MALRDTILDQLSGLFANDHISVEEYERRVDLVMKASDETALVRLQKDLVPSHQASHGHQGLSNPEQGSTKELVAIFSGSTLKGVYDAPNFINAAAVFGGIEIDLREARIPHEGIIIEAAAIMGGIEVFLPDEVNIEADGLAIFGGIDKPASKNIPGAPTIKIRGTAIFGGVDIRYPKKKRR